MASFFEWLFLIGLMLHHLSTYCPDWRFLPLQTNYTVDVAPALHILSRLEGEAVALPGRMASHRMSCYWMWMDWPCPLSGRPGASSAKLNTSRHHCCRSRRQPDLLERILNIQLAGYFRFCQFDQSNHNRQAKLGSFGVEINIIDILRHHVVC